MNNEPVAWGYKDSNGDICDCICPEEHDRAEGDYTIPLYTQEYVNRLQAEIEALKENMCKAIYEEAAYCYDTGDYMLDYSDCQEIIRGTWVRPLYAGQEDSAILRKAQE